MCLPSVGSERQTEILRIAVKTGCKLKTSPSLLEMTDTSNGGRIRDVNITDLLSRPEVELNRDVCGYLKDQIVLVTGGGGSIGSELCRQVSKYHPKKLLYLIYMKTALTCLNSSLMLTTRAIPKST